MWVYVANFIGYGTLEICGFKLALTRFNLQGCLNNIYALGIYISVAYVVSFIKQVERGGGAGTRIRRNSYLD
jgi:hypothetical protein